LQEKLLNQELFAEFCDEFTREMNRLRMERRASLSSAKREVERISARIKKLLNLMLDDEVAVDDGKAEIKTLDIRRKELQAKLETADEPPPLLPV
jgi:site-specific DNA recombinase